MSKYNEYQPGDCIQCLDYKDMETVVMCLKECGYHFIAEPKEKRILILKVPEIK